MADATWTEIDNEGCGFVHCRGVARVTENRVRHT